MAEIGIRLGGPDRVSIRAALSFPKGLYVSPLVENHDPRLHRFFIESIFANGSVRFDSEESEIIIQFRRLNGHDLDAQDAEQVKAIIEYYVQRIRNYGHIETLYQGEIPKATVCGEGACCPNKNGETISVVDSMSKLKWFREISHRRYGQQVFGLDWGFPPFHFTCQCRMEGVIDGAECLRVNKKTQRKWIFRKLW